MPRHPLAPARSDRRLAFVIGALLAVGLGWAYWPTLAGLSRRWSDDPQYSHGYVVPLIALLVLWHRRRRFPAAEMRSNWWGLLPLLCGVLLRLAAARFHFEWLDAVSLLPTLAGISFLVGGWPLVRWAWPAAAFVCFMLPLPFQVEIALAHPLQRIATVVSTYALQTVGLPAVAEGNIILIDDLRIGVLEACSGLGMLVTFFALSTAVAFVVNRPLLDRLILFASAIPIGIFVNVVRITVTGILHKTAGSAIANAVFHDLAGWLMMPLALGILWLEMLYLARLFPLPTASPATRSLPPFAPPRIANQQIPSPTPGR